MVPKGLIAYFESIVMCEVKTNLTNWIFDLPIVAATKSFRQSYVISTSKRFSIAKSSQNNCLNPVD
jgi:hypothetical protein